MTRTSSNFAPVLFLIFNRPEVTARVFDVIQSMRPKRLFIAGDGPRPDKMSEREIVQETRRIVENVDWDCEVVRRYQETNLGCRLGVSTAIMWFFEQVEEGIILEDDCLPNDSFFPFCSELLERFRDDNRIGLDRGNELSG